MTEPADRADLLHQSYWIIMGLGVLCVGLLLAVIYLLWLRPDPVHVSADGLQDADLREQVIKQLIGSNPGISDSHNDPDVGRINQPNLQGRMVGGVPVSTNRFGIRERNYALPKPPGTVRVVILGDSFVFGYGVRSEERLGIHLERWLTERTTNFDGPIEVLQIGVPSWTFTNEVAYLRRQLSELQPDLVFHISVPNDIADGRGARGFGVPSGFSPQVRKRADSRINTMFARQFLGFPGEGYLRRAIDYEGRQRYQDAVAKIQRLARLIEQMGGQYRLLLHHRHQVPITRQHLGRHFEPTHVVYMGSIFGNDRQYWTAENDWHWNPAGHLKVAQLLYGLIVRDGLLPQVNPAPWDEAAQVVEEIADGGRVEAERGDLDEAAILALTYAPPLAASIDFEKLDKPTAAQIHGGIDKARRVSPYASFVLKNDGGTHLRIQGQTFPRPELDGAHVRVFVDAEAVGLFELRADTELDLRYALPEAVAEHPYLSVRFEASDYVYQGPDLQHCVVFYLKRIALEA